MLIGLCYQNILARNGCITTLENPLVVPRSLERLQLCVQTQITQTVLDLTGEPTMAKTVVN